MESRKNTLLLFAKLPEPGMAKTRLSVLKDGVFSPEDASDLFGCMLLDVVDTTLAAFAKLAFRDSGDALANDADAANSYELVVSTAPAKNADAMREFLEAEFGPLGSAPFPIKVISDSGKSFDAHYNDAFDQTWNMGADCILSMGADMPTLTADDIIRGFDKLHSLHRRNRQGIVLSPDQAMGVSIVGWNRETEFNHDGVYYNPTGLTVLPAYIDKARKAGIDAVWMPPVPDVDTIADLAHAMTLMDALAYCAECENVARTAAGAESTAEGLTAKDPAAVEESPTKGDTVEAEATESVTGSVATNPSCPHQRATEPDTPWPRRTMAKLDELGCSMVRVPPNELRDPRDVIDE